MKIKREMAIWSTAVGYDIKVFVLGERGECTLRKYRNVTSASMKRFYRLSESYMTVHGVKNVTWRQSRRIFN